MVLFIVDYKCRYSYEDTNSPAAFGIENTYYGSGGYVVDLSYNSTQVAEKLGELHVTNLLMALYLIFFSRTTNGLIYRLDVYWL